jgi:hypothetical protein
VAPKAIPSGLKASKTGKIAFAPETNAAAAPDALIDLSGVAP